MQSGAVKLESVNTCSIVVFISVDTLDVMHRKALEFNVIAVL